VGRAANVDGRRFLWVVLGEIDVRPRGGVQNEIRRRIERRRRQLDVPIAAT